MSRSGYSEDFDDPLDRTPLEEIPPPQPGPRLAAAAGALYAPAPEFAEALLVELRRMAEALFGVGALRGPEAQALRARLSRLCRDGSHPKPSAALGTELGRLYLALGYIPLAAAKERAREGCRAALLALERAEAAAIDQAMREILEPREG